ncbi:Rid family hydrolase [Blastomonas sp.]|uniref:Rid family hydrolase n=1 Tax=Blastomonas sp. TaxID=1909299 RepID=UPI003593363F
MSGQRARLIAGALVLTACVVPASAGTRTLAEVLYSENPEYRAFQESAGFSDAVILPDGTVYLSGVVVGPGDDEAAFDRAYQNISSILIRAGVSWEDVVDITSYHTDIDAQLATMSKVHKSYVVPPYTSWTAVQVSRLYDPKGIAEIKIVAKRVPR